MHQNVTGKISLWKRPTKNGSTRVFEDRVINVHHFHPKVQENAFGEVFIYAQDADNASEIHYGLMTNLVNTRRGV